MPWFLMPNILLSASLNFHMTCSGAGRAARFGVVSMCIGSGMGAAAVFERGGEVDDVPVRAVSGRQIHLSKDAVV